MNSAEKQKGDPQVAAIRRLIDARLKARTRQDAAARAVTAHPDEDVINAFVEGWLEESRSKSLISHLISCPSCLHLTAQLIRFDPATEETTSSTLDVEPGPLQRFFDRLASGMIPIQEDAVFAYQDKEESDNGEKKDETAQKPSLDDSDRT
ncbi:MAG TPA: hypothetical protein VFU37_12330 [Pyrinomonadaceae bacterium]|nr:hypothetical protein [Pyrinomonadaceae bacterium]